MVEKQLRTKNQPVGPYLNASQRNVIQVQAAMSVVLAAITATYFRGGFSYLIAPEEEYKERTRKSLPALMKYPEAGDYLTNNSSSHEYSQQKALFEIATAKYTKENFWNKEIIAVYRTYFPDHFMKLEGYTGIVKDDATGRDYHDHAMKFVDKDPLQHRGWRDIYDEAEALKYVPSQTGGSDTFLALNRLNQELKTIGSNAFPDPLLIKMMDEKIVAAGHDERELRKITNDWTKKRSENWEKYMEYYMVELGRLFTDGDTGGKTDQMAALMEEVNDLKLQLSDSRSENSQTSDAVAALLETLKEQAQAEVPGLTTPAVAAVAAAPAGTEDRPATLKDLAELLKACNSSTGNNVSQPKSLSKRKCFNQYCYSRGINTKCDGTCCETSRKCVHPPPEGHKSKATYQNQMGGSTRNSHLWGKYVLPGGAIYNDKECTDEFNNRAYSRRNNKK